MFQILKNVFSNLKKIFLDKCGITLNPDLIFFPASVYFQGFDLERTEVWQKNKLDYLTSASAKG